MFQTHFLLSFPFFLVTATASDSRAWIDQMTEEVRCPWRKSEGLPETSQSISWATAKVPLAAGLTGHIPVASSWPVGCVSVPGQVLLPLPGVPPHFLIH